MHRSDEAAVSWWAANWVDRLVREVGSSSSFGVARGAHSAGPEWLAGLVWVAQRHRLQLPWPCPSAPAAARSAARRHRPPAVDWPRVPVTILRPKAARALL